MFYLNPNGWNHYSAIAKNWQPCHSTQFNDAVSQACQKEAVMASDSVIALPGDAIPPFSGSKILCVGRNYRKHAQEMGNDVPDRPLWFSKPPSSIIGEGGSVILPENSGRIDYEGELALVICRRTRKVAVEDALDHIGGVTACLDMTARELQKSDGQWTRAKGFDTFLPLAGLVAPFSPDWAAGAIETRKNDVIVQQSSLKAMVFGFAELIADISACMTLEPGDLILTGTPAGIGPVTHGDRLQVTISGPATITLRVNVA